MAPGPGKGQGGGVGGGAPDAPFSLRHFRALAAELMVLTRCLSCRSLLPVFASLPPLSPLPCRLSFLPLFATSLRCPVLASFLASLPGAFAMHHAGYARSPPPLITPPAAACKCCQQLLPAHASCS